MSLYRNLGPITFLAETEAFEIFKTLKQQYIFQIKPDVLKLYDKISHIAKLFEQQFPTIKIHFYEEILKPKAFLLQNCLKVDIVSPSIQQLQEILKVIIKVMRMWPIDKIGEVNENLIYKCQGKLFFFSVPFFNYEPVYNSSKDFFLTKILIEFIGKLLIEPNAWQGLFLKKIKECKQLNSILLQLQYFIKLSKITIKDNLSTITSQLKIPHYSSHNNTGNHSTNKMRRKYHLFRQSQKENNKSIKQFTNTLEESQLQARNCSRAIHVSNVSLHATLKRYKSKSKSQSVKRFHSLRTNSKKQIQHPFHQSNFNTTDKFKPLATEKPKTSQKSIKLQSRQYQHSQHKISSGRQSKQQIIISQKNRWMKEMVNKSLQKWKPKKIEKDKSNKLISKAGITKQTGKKKLKKTHCIPNKYENLLLSNNNKQQTHQSKQEKETNTNTNKISRQMITKIPLKQYREENDEISSSQTKRKPNTKNDKKNSTNIEAKKQLCDKFEQMELRLKNYDCIGQAVANTSIHLSKFQKILWQIPMFFFYKQYYIFRIQIEQKGMKSIHEQNKQIEQSLKKLLAVSRKKIAKSQMGCDNLKKYLNMDLVGDNKNILMTVFKQYYEALVSQLQQFKELSKHIIEISEAFLIIEGEFIDFDKKSKAEKDPKYEYAYLSENIKEVRKKLKNV